MSEEYTNQNEETKEQEISTEATSNDNNIDATDEQLESMSDEEFANYLESHIIPDTTSKASTIDSKETSDTPIENQPEDTTKDDSEPSGEATEASNDTSKDSNEQTIDYKAALESIMSPFKANGKEIQPRTLEDVRSLMQMGANYTKKMQAIAPMRKTVETLNNAHITNEDLNFLIDIHNGNKEAIKQLLKKNNVEPMDLDLEAINYTPTNKTASDADVEFREVMEDFKDYIPKINEVITNKWDEKSRQALFSNTRLLRGLGEEMQMGRFDAIQTVLEREKTMGRYRGVSDLEAYSDIATKYEQWLMQKQQTEQQQQYQQYQQQQVQQQQVQQNASKSKAAPNRQINNTKPSKMTPEQMYALSDEEFEKLSIKDII